MTTMLLNRASVWIGTGIAACMTVAFCAEPPESRKADPKAKAVPASELKADERARVTVSTARDRAKTTHEIYAATLNIMHHRYFHGGRTIVPARAMEDIFSDVKSASRAQARWISVNMQAMNIDHEPRTEFEKRAAREIADGKTELEIVEDGYYRRAGAIPLASDCINCHAGFFKEPAKGAKFAALVISMPVHREPAN